MEGWGSHAQLVSTVLGFGLIDTFLDGVIRDVDEEDRKLLRPDHLFINKATLEAT